MDEDLTAQLARIEELLTIVAKALVAPVMAAELENEKMDALYQMTGEVTAKEAAKKIACSMTTVSDAWKRWESMGFVKKDGRRYLKVF